MKSATQAARLGLILLVATVLSACASRPSSTISLIPADQIAQQTSKDGLFSQPVKWERTKPGCKGECPTLKVDSIVFPGVRKLSELIDHALAVMTGIGASQTQPYDTIAQYEDYFWKTAAPRDSALLSAKTRYRNKNITTIELNTWQYYTGGAHGISATQFLNWDNTAEKVLGMAAILQPGQHAAYVKALQQVHSQWLATQSGAQNDPEMYNRIWPFQPSDNFAFTDVGLVIKYDSYQIAPYSSGQPELTIPYSVLQGILKPEYLPA